MPPSFAVVEMCGYLLEKKMVFLICYAYFLGASTFQTKRSAALDEQLRLYLLEDDLIVQLRLHNFTFHLYLLVRASWRRHGALVRVTAGSARVRADLACALAK